MRYALLGVLAACALTVGCGAPTKPSTTATTPPASTTTEVAAPAKAPLVADPVDAPRYLAALRAIHPELVTKEDRALGYGKEACHNLRNEGEEREVAVKMARRRHSTSTVELTMEQAEQAVVAAERYYCPA